MKDAAGTEGMVREVEREKAKEEGEGKKGGDGERERIDGLGGGRDRRPTERRDKALTPLPGCILAGRQLWIGNITAAGN